MYERNYSSVQNWSEGQILGPPIRYNVWNDRNPFEGPVQLCNNFRMIMSSIISKQYFKPSASTAMSRIYCVQPRKTPRKRRLRGFIQSQRCVRGCRHISHVESLWIAWDIPSMAGKPYNLFHFCYDWSGNPITLVYKGTTRIVYSKCVGNFTGVSYWQLDKHKSFDALLSGLLHSCKAQLEALHPISAPNLLKNNVTRRHTRTL